MSAATRIIVLLLAALNIAAAAGSAVPRPALVAKNAASTLPRPSPLVVAARTEAGLIAAGIAVRAVRPLLGLIRRAVLTVLTAIVAFITPAFGLTLLPVYWIGTQLRRGVKVLLRLLPKTKPVRPLLYAVVKASSKLPIMPLLRTPLLVVRVLAPLARPPAAVLMGMAKGCARASRGVWRALPRALPVLLPLAAAAVQYRSPELLTMEALRSTASRAQRHLRTLLLEAATTHRSQTAITATLAGSAASIATLSSNEGLRRSMRFNQKMVPLAIEYNFYRWLLGPCSERERHVVFQRLHKRHAPEVLGAIYDLRGFYIKIGQVLSSFGDTFVPSQFVDALSVLQDAVPPQPASYVRELVESELKVPLEDVFEAFDLETPLGAASIGQVHKACLKNGLSVVVKLQYPDAHRFFVNDIRCLKGFCRVFSPENVQVVGYMMIIANRLIDSLM